MVRVTTAINGPCPNIPTSFLFRCRQAADVEARIHAEEMEQRDRAVEIAREKRMKKIKYMTDMDDGIEVRQAITFYT